MFRTKYPYSADMPLNNYKQTDMQSGGSRVTSCVTGNCRKKVYALPMLKNIYLHTNSTQINKYMNTSIKTPKSLPAISSWSVAPKSMEYARAVGYCTDSTCEGYWCIIAQSLNLWKNCQGWVTDACHASWLFGLYITHLTILKENRNLC